MRSHDSRDSRRRFLRGASAAAAGAAVFRWLPGAVVSGSAAQEPARDGASGEAIDRRALVARHAPHVRGVDPFAVLSVGNGDFAFTADVTGLQTFPDAYREIPLATQSSWGWHSFPNPEGHDLADATTMFDVDGRSVGYADRQSSPAGQWLRQSPHRLSLARIGFVLTRQDGTSARLEDLSEIDQRLDLWTGTLESRFRFDGHVVQVTTCVHPSRDLIAVRVEAPTLASARRALRIDFPYGATVHTGDPADWSRPDQHRTMLERIGVSEARWLRELDDDGYVVRAAWSAGELSAVDQHGYRVTPREVAAPFELVVEFLPAGALQAAGDSATATLPSASDVRAAAAQHWGTFWSTGGAVELAGSTDPRANELERRIVLSQYLTAIQCAGSLPPQETGLTFNSWHGKFHLEMHWWHAAHFALWDRLPLLEKSLPWYRTILPRAQATARAQGYAGARWPKMVGPDGRESPSTIGVFLIWQQPHPIYFAELVYRARPTRETLETYREIVHETAAFMASYTRWEDAGQRYVLGPPLIPAQELHPARTTFNSTFELAYWEFGLETAQRWRERLGLTRDPQWDHVLDHLSMLPIRDGLYTNAESDPDTFTDRDKRRDHPTLLAAYGMIGSSRVDTEAMRRTLRRVLADWQWDETWGWDYPLVAMTAARLGEPELAVDALLMDTPKNRFLPNGHNYQREGLTVYLPGNGGLLASVAMLAAGWDRVPDATTPGFPREGWSVRCENIRKPI